MALKYNPLTAQEYLRQLGKRELAIAPMEAAAIDAQRFAARPVLARGLTATAQFLVNDIGSQIQIVPGDPARRLIVFWLSAGSATVLPNGLFGIAGVGFALLSNGTPFIVTENDWGAFVQVPWMAQGTGIGSNIGVLTERYVR